MEKKYFKYILPNNLINELPQLECEFVVLQKDEDENFNGEMVDIIWKQDEPEQFTEFRVIPTTHKHWFGGQEELWRLCNE